MFKSLVIKKPVVIIGCPRSGTSLLFRILSTSPDLWSLYRESNDIWNCYFTRFSKSIDNETLGEQDLNKESKKYILNEFHKRSLNNYLLGLIFREKILKNKFLLPQAKIIGHINFLYKKFCVGEYRIIEKSPRNCFRVPFINKLFSDCKFIFLKRNGCSNINSLIEGWHAKERYKRENKEINELNIKGYRDKHWKFVKPPGWREYFNKPLEEVCAFQWVSSNNAAIEGLASIEKDRKMTISYEELTENPEVIIKQICNYTEIPFSQEIKKLTKNLPVVNYVTKPQKDKWKKNLHLIKNIYPVIEPVMNKLGYSMDF